VRQPNLEEIARLLDIHKNGPRMGEARSSADQRAKTGAFSWAGARGFSPTSPRVRKATLSARPYLLSAMPSAKSTGRKHGRICADDGHTGNLRGICPDCDRLIHRRVNQAKIKAIQGNLEITFADAPPRIRERITPSVNCDSGKEG
jgi:hypothetical protein